MIEKAMYLKGLCDGVDLDKSTKEGKLIAALIDLVTDLCNEIDDMQSKMSSLEDYCEELDADLGDVEEVLLDLDDEDEDEDEDFNPADYMNPCDGDCASCDMDCGFDDDDDDDLFGDDDDEDDEELYFEITCPACGDIINFDASIDPENLRCPNCGEKFECIVEEDDYKATIEGDEV